MMREGSWERSDVSGAAWIWDVIGRELDGLFYGSVQVDRVEVTQFWAVIVTKGRMRAHSDEENGWQSRKTRMYTPFYETCLSYTSLVSFPFPVLSWCDLETEKWSESDHLFFFFFLACFPSPLGEQEHHSLFRRSEREQLSVEGAGSRWQVMNGWAGCKWQYADKPDHLQMDVGKMEDGWGGDGERRQVKSGARRGGGGERQREGVNPSRIISQQQEEVEEAQPPARQIGSFFLELMEARGHVSAVGNTPQVAHHRDDQQPQSRLGFL